jgi:hypothetical protein
MVNKIDIDCLTGLGDWTTCKPKELGDPQLGVVANNIGVFRHRYSQSAIVGCTCWAHLDRLGHG